MKKTGIILIIIQAFAVFGGLVSGSLTDMITSIRNMAGIFELLGFFIFGIVGLILLLRAKSKEGKNQKES